MFFQFFLPLTISFVLAAVLTAVVRRVAPRVGLVDLPDGRQKLHARATPLGGGVAVLLAAAGAVVMCRASLGDAAADGAPGLGVLLGAAAWIVALGVLDDRHRLRARAKLLGQIPAAALLVAGGLSIDNIEFLGWHGTLGWAAAPLTLVWLVGATNAVNLLDGMDALAATLGTLMALTIAALAGWNGQAMAALIALALAGGLMGFLLHNRPPARIFLGDAGSMLIGLLLAALSVVALRGTPDTLPVSALLTLWGLPILDSTCAVLRRTLRGGNPCVGDREHLHHRLRARAGSTWQALRWIASAGLITSATAWASAVVGDERIAWAGLAAVVGALFVSGAFVRDELDLLFRRLTAACALPFARRPAFGQHAAHAADPTHSSSWTTIWNALCESLGSLALGELRLQLHLPGQAEASRAVWNSGGGDVSQQPAWRMDIPLRVGDRPVGRLSLADRPQRHLAPTELAEMLRGLSSFEQRLHHLVAGHGLHESVPSRFQVAD
jgi:UDP-GlcNAc:undecaprenyl-phosphate/decaprenyl-phosphate GlcNAc-1-phosphate transferase